MAHGSTTDSDIYVVPSLGGEPRMLAKNGCCGHYSPDGSQIAYVAFAGLDFSFAVIPSAGGVPASLPLPPGLVRGPPIWSPDGRKLLATVCSNVKTGADCDWFAVSSDPHNASAAIEMGMAQVSKRYGVYPGLAAEWRRDGVVFAARSGDSTNLWRVAISPRTYRIDGAPSRLTTASENEYAGAMDREGRTVFEAVSSTIDLWEIAADGNTGESREEPQRLTRDLGLKAMPSISDKGDMLAFVSDRLGNRDVWVRNVATGRERALTETPGDEDRAVISHDGSRVAYMAMDGNKAVINMVSTAGGLPERVCDECGAPADWFHDGRRLVLQYFADASHARATIGVLDLVSKKQSNLIAPGEYELYRGHVSPDDRWMVIHAFVGYEKGTREFVVPLGDGHTTDPSNWIPITDGTTFDDAPRWSPDGNSIYYLSSRDGSLCIWLQHLDPTRKTPIGAPIAVQHFHGKRRSISMIPTEFTDLAVGRDRIIFNLAEVRGSIWMAEYK
jgi:Tol biopolymer transport system component